MISDSGATYEDVDALVKGAQKTLERNYTGAFTKPALKLYPHQWSWDAAFISMGYIHYNQDLAEQELLHLFRGQWKNGMVPHIVFGELTSDEEYFPKPGFWKTENAPHASRDPKTSGLCQPPVHATAVRHILEYADDRAQAERFAAQLFPKLKGWHDYLYRERDPFNEGLVYLRHPWESGQDNSPIWDEPLKRLEFSEDQIPFYQRHDTNIVDEEERPGKDMYDRYVYLVDFSRQRNYDERKIREDGCPFLIQDVLFNTLLCRANRDLARVAEVIGEKPDPFLENAEQTARAMNEKLWDDEHGMYIDYDLHTEQGIHAHALAGFIPFLADIPDENRAQRMFAYLNTHCFCHLDAECFAAPSYDRSGPGYSSSQYWRGPIWINMNWLLSEGLERYGYEQYCRRIRESIMELPRRSGFCEYYDPDTAKGYGSQNFSWSAALLLDNFYRHKIK